MGVAWDYNGIVQAVCLVSDIYSKQAHVTCLCTDRKVNERERERETEREREREREKERERGKLRERDSFPRIDGAFGIPLRLQQEAHSSYVMLSNHEAGSNVS